MIENIKNDKIVIIDFGSQVTRLIARRIRELGVYSEILTIKQLNNYKNFNNIKGIILSGGPATVTKKSYPNIPLDKLTDVSIHEGPILNAFGVVRMQFETAGAAPFILTGVKNSEQFRDLVLRQRDSLVSNPQHAGPSISSNEVLVEIRDLLKSIDSRIE